MMQSYFAVGGKSMTIISGSYDDCCRVYSAVIINQPLFRALHRVQVTHKEVFQQVLHQEYNPGLLPAVMALWEYHLESPGFLQAADRVVVSLAYTGCFIFVKNKK